MWQIRDNIALGDPAGRTSDEDRDAHIRLAAELGGATDLIAQLRDGFDTYLVKPQTERWSGPLDGTKNAAGRVFDVTGVLAAAGMKKGTREELSGGQMQRLAV